MTVSTRNSAKATRRRFAHVALAWLATLAACPTGTVSAADDPRNFSYCAPPVSPSCMEQRSTFAEAVSVELCKRDVQRFADSLIAYRACLNHETERAFVQGNREIDRFKCRLGLKKPPCP